jgi:DNA-binding transcriptional regulator YdaS (Cro superfamily)
MEHEHIRAAVDLVGTQKRLAALLAERSKRPIGQGHIWGWLKRRKRVPPEMALHIEALSVELGQKIAREDLCEHFPWHLAAKDATATRRRA